MGRKYGDKLGTHGRRYHDDVYDRMMASLVWDSICAHLQYIQYSSRCALCILYQCINQYCTVQYILYIRYSVHASSTVLGITPDIAYRTPYRAYEHRARRSHDQTSPSPCGCNMEERNINILLDFLAPLSPFPFPFPLPHQTSSPEMKKR